jgi:predicted DNA-binding transcriptional regulator AlpA
MTNQAVVTPATPTHPLDVSISETELCVLWNISPKTAYDHRKAGKMPPSFKSGTQVRYLLSDIEIAEKPCQSDLGHLPNGANNPN